MTGLTIHLLLVEDHPGDADLLGRALRDAPSFQFALVRAESLEETLVALESHHIDLILLDLSLPDSHGLETFLQVHHAAPTLPIVVLTGDIDEELATRTVQEGAQDYLLKGELNPRLLVRSIRYAMGRKHAELQLLASERAQRELLTAAVREAHHRIKNNLQAISDLLYLELVNGEAGPGLDALRESMERVQAIALVHDLLSQNEDVQTVDLRSVLERLVPMVLQSSGVAPGSVRVQLNVCSLRVSSKRATTLALIVNELTTNAAKHAFCPAFSTQHRGALVISLRQSCEDLVLRVHDNGPGLPPAFNMDLHSRVGLGVVRVMAERDLGGRFQVTNNDGACAEVSFRW